MQLAFDLGPSQSVPNIQIAFRSGMSTSKDFWAAADAGADIGVVAGELTNSMIFLALPSFLSGGGRLFVDSGAFAEFKTGESPDFDQVLRVYESLAEPGLRTYDPGQLHVVAPDKVGDQLATLDRLIQFAPRVRALIDAGCSVIVPIQRGGMPAVEMFRRTVEILGTADFVLGIPSNKEALSIDECASLIHSRFHILGRVQPNADQIARLRALTDNNPSAAITADANWLRGRIPEICQRAAVVQMGRNANATGSQWLISSRSEAITAAICNDATWGRLTPQDQQGEPYV